VLDEIGYIAIEGPIGAGKTSLAHALAERLGAKLALEPADDNPFLEKFYADMAGYALATQLAFLALRYRQQAGLSQRVPRPWMRVISRSASAESNTTTLGFGARAAIAS
jgi:deoxyadenosine/deoxycytidine kinase